MNINVIVVNLPRDFRPADASNHGRESDERFARAFSTPDAVTHGPISGVASIDEVIDLIPQNGAWVGKAGMVSTRTDSSRLTGGRKALYSSPTVATYNHEGKVHYSSQDKGLRINITA
jgi:hypothetical protein